MAVKITFDTRGFDKLIDDILKKLGKIDDSTLQEMGDTLLNLSSKEVPHDKGILQSSGKSELVKHGLVEVGYHTDYAARLHEHPEYRFQRGRKGKYLEDPLKNNLRRWLQEYARGMGVLLK